MYVYDYSSQSPSTESAPYYWPIDIALLEQEIVQLKDDIAKHLQMLADKNRDLNGLWILTELLDTALNFYRQRVTELEAMLKPRLDPRTRRQMFPLAVTD